MKEEQKGEFMDETSEKRGEETREGLRGGRV